MSRAGRPTTLTPKVQEEICKTLRAGNFLDTAITYAGLSRATVREWMRRGRAELARLEADPRARLLKTEQPYVDFVEALEQAMAHAETLHVAMITSASKKDWKASAWMLERAHPQRWGAKHRLDVSGRLDMRTEIVVEIGAEGDEEGDEAQEDVNGDGGDGL
jgi:hypothetical protein